MEFKDYLIQPEPQKRPIFSVNITNEIKNGTFRLIKGNFTIVIMQIFDKWFSYVSKPMQGKNDKFGLWVPDIDGNPKIQSVFYYDELKE